MFSLHSVIPAAVPERTDVIPAAYEGIKQEQASYTWVRQQSPPMAVRDWVSSQEQIVLNKLNKLNWDTFNTGGSLPAVMHPTADKLLQKALGLPSAEVGSILDVAEGMGFLVLPVEYLNPVSYANEGSGMKNSIKEFLELLKEMDVYVLTPPVFYDMGKHIASENPNQQSYIPQNLQQAFMVISLTVTAMRAQQKQINALSGRVANLESVVLGLKQSLEQFRSEVQVQLNQMQIQLERMHQERVAETAARKKAEARLEAEIQIRLEDPMLFAVPRGVLLTDRKAHVIVGPAWGPDITEAVLKASKLKPVLAQQNLVRRTLNGVYGASSNGKPYSGV